MLTTAVIELVQQFHHDTEIGNVAQGSSNYSPRAMFIPWYLQ